MLVFRKFFMVIHILIFNKLFSLKFQRFGTQNFQLCACMNASFSISVLHEKILFCILRVIFCVFGILKLLQDVYSFCSPGTRLCSQHCVFVVYCVCVYVSTGFRINLYTSTEARMALGSSGKYRDWCTVPGHLLDISCLLLTLLYKFNGSYIYVLSVSILCSSFIEELQKLWKFGIQTWND